VFFGKGVAGFVMGVMRGINVYTGLGYVLAEFFLVNLGSEI
jgi:hypothetical protein